MPNSSSNRFSLKKHLIAFSQQISRWLTQEDLITFLKKSLQSTLTPLEKKATVFIVLSIILFPFLSILFNWLGPKYQMLPPPFIYISYLPGAILIMTLCSLLQNKLKRVGIIGIQLFLVVGAIKAASSMASFASGSPFFNREISHFLNNFDLLLGLDQAKIMDWIAQHETVKKILFTCYDSLRNQIRIVIIGLICLGHRQTLAKMILLFLWTALIAGLIYYFVPAYPPMHVVQSPHFSEIQKHLLDFTYNLHHHKPYVYDPKSGLIAFPSCHIMWSLVCTSMYYQATKRAVSTWKKSIFIAAFTISVVINCGLMIATVTLGYHYALDVIAGFVIFGITLFALNRLEKSDR